ncbi:MAG: hypothetical protein COB15_08070 [Flavobacteriales bacterium]|nr:MAG: hypothetical protein COB15_08070 [Flavobacteriales bacterium]
MKTYISLLRGINVSGQKKILMADLKSLYEELGFTKVQTYIQSGNVVFEYQETKTADLQQVIFNKIQSHYGFEVPNLILLPTEVEKALKNNPYQGIEKMYFVFLAEQPEKENIKTLSEFNFDNEFYNLGHKMIYFHCPNGYGKAKLSNNFFENKLKVSATTRNLRTTNKLLEMANSQCHSEENF